MCFSDIVYNVFQLGSHDGIGGTVKRLVYQEVSPGCIVIEDAQQFANEADKLCKIVNINTNLYFTFDCCNYYDCSPWEINWKLHRMTKTNMGFLVLYILVPYLDGSKVL